VEVDEKAIPIDGDDAALRNFKIER